MPQYTWLQKWSNLLKILVLRVGCMLHMIITCTKNRTFDVSNLVTYISLNPLHTFPLMVTICHITNLRYNSRFLFLKHLYNSVQNYHNNDYLQLFLIVLVSIASWNKFILFLSQFFKETSLHPIDIFIHHLFFQS